jgi:O-antigen/teichoic acid export membrane protein
MTRLLAPEMFGVMAIATAVMAGLVMFSDFGLRPSIVQSPRGNEATFLNTAWSLQILRGFLIFICAFGVSLLLALANRVGMVPSGTVYAEPILPWVVAVSSLSAIILGFESTKLSEASRYLSLGRATQLELFAQAAGLVCMVVWASFDRSIWALVSGGVSSNLVRVVLSHAWMPGTANRWHWDIGAVRDILGFGKWILAASVLGFLVNNGDRLLLGGLLDTSMLGVFTIAALIFGSIEQLLSKLIGEVSYPALSEIIRERRADLKANYYRFHVAIASMTYFCAGILAAAGEPLIHLIYDSRYAEAGWMLQVLALGLLSVPFRVAALCFVALGMPRVHSNIIAIRLVVMLVAMPVGFHFFGTQGALWGLVLSHLVYALATVGYKLRFELFDLRKELWLLAIVPTGMAVGGVLKLATAIQ